MLKKQSMPPIQMVSTKTLLLLLSLLLATTGHQQTSEHGFSSATTASGYALFKIPEWLADDEDDGADALAAPVEHPAAIGHGLATPRPSQRPHTSLAPAPVASHPIRGPPPAHA